MTDKTKAVTAVDQDEFEKSVTPTVVKNAQDLYLFECPATIVIKHPGDGKHYILPSANSVCGNVHFRHAGYLEALMPFRRPDKSQVVDKSSYHVMVCTVCRATYIWLNEQMYDVSDIVDLEAWAVAERELHAATGPGGQC